MKDGEKEMIRLLLMLMVSYALMFLIPAVILAGIIILLARYFL